MKDHGKVKHITFEQIPSADNIADLFTKPLACEHQGGHTHCELSWRNLPLCVRVSQPPRQKYYTDTARWVDPSRRVEFRYFSTQQGGFQYYLVMFDTVRWGINLS